MSHRSGGAYRALEQPSLYEYFQRSLGARRARQRFVRDFLEPFAGATLLDVGCGTGSLLDDLPGDVTYVGFDPNPAYVEAAQRRYGPRGRFYCTRVGSEPPGLLDGSFDFVVAKAVVHHLTDGEAHQLLGAGRRYLSERGRFVSLDPVRHEGQSLIARLMLAGDRGSRVRSPEEYRRLAAAHFDSVDTWLLTDMLHVPYSHFVMRAR